MGITVFSQDKTTLKSTHYNNEIPALVFKYKGTATEISLSVFTSWIFGELYSME